ncbi:hypothetical protein M407DRAFT_21532 [Tulasnella calospora MUT 4182]|uniref:Uncharacterized protein n=1 Tax=Tulasnella calospora MUT 4182 TaxID=1051891 RepID=A0A0C3QPL8_9AGAM|nr:hypothetical protein M407DRAFT_21532 [Tulasnella calospora MUT 4182]
MSDGTEKPLSFFWGIAKLELFHFLVAVLASTVVANTVPNLKSFSERPFPFDLAILSDYNRLHKVAIPLIVLNAVTVGLAFLVICVDLGRKKTLPLFIEVLWGMIALAVECASLILCAKSHFRAIKQVFGGTTGGVIGRDGKLLIEDAAAVVLVSWETTTMLTVATITCLTLHLLWLLVVSIRHRKIRPRVFTEPTSGGYRWTLRADPPTPNFQTVKALDLSVAGKGDLVWNPTASPDDSSTQENKLRQLS